jgi:hypothetical protein
MPDTALTDEDTDFLATSAPGQDGKAPAGK